MENYIDLIPLRLIIASSSDYFLFVLRNPQSLRLLFKVKGYKRFIGGWYIGYLIGRDNLLKPKEAQLFANIYALWVIAIISLDACIDNSLNTLNAVRNFTQRIKSSIRSCQDIDPTLFYTSDSSYEYIVLSIFKNLSDKIYFMQTHCKRVNIEYFIQYAVLLIDGEELSFRQRVYEKNLNLEWYFKTVMPLKTHPFLLAPMALLFKVGENDAFAFFKDDLRELDQACNYWQIQDDIADLENDLECGILTAPTFFLMEQCRIAFDISLGVISNSVQLIRALRKNGMYDLCSMQNENSFFDQARSILSNSEIDKELPFQDLLKKYNLLSISIDGILQSKDYKSLRPLIISSGVRIKLLANIHKYDCAVLNLSPNRRSAIKFISVLMRNAIVRAKIRCNEF